MKASGVVLLSLSTLVIVLSIVGYLSMDPKNINLFFWNQKETKTNDLSNPYHFQIAYKEFMNFIVTHNKQYESKEHHDSRFKIFLDNYFKI